MKKTLSRLLAIAMTASLVLSGCGGTGGSTSTEEGTSTEGILLQKEQAQKAILLLQKAKLLQKQVLKTKLKIWFLVFCLAVSSKPLICCTLRELRTLKT